MKNERIYKAIGNVDDSMLEYCSTPVRTVSKRPLWIKWGAAAACACLIVTGAMAVGGRIGGPESGIISSYNSGQTSSSIYAAPENGKTLFFPDLKAALEKNDGNDATYFVAIDFFHDSTSLSPDSDEVQAELDRLAAEGLRVGFATSWTYQGDMEKTEFLYPAGYFTAEQLENLDAKAEYGYAFSFAVNGDGSPVSPDQNLASEFTD